MVAGQYAFNQQLQLAAGRLEPVPWSADLVKRMLATARQRLRDAEFTQNSDETRFDCANATIRALADIGPHINGFRTSASKPGHHQTAIQCLAHTLGLDAALNECLNPARAMVTRIECVLRDHPELGG